MGKVHRIKRSFYKVISQQPWKTIKPGNVQHFNLATAPGKKYGEAYVTVGKRYDGSIYLSHSTGSPYHPLMQSLIRDVESRDSSMR